MRARGEVEVRALPSGGRQEGASSVCVTCFLVAVGEAGRCSCGCCSCGCER
jgi:hypothetical protein